MSSNQPGYTVSQKIKKIFGLNPGEPKNLKLLKGPPAGTVTAIGENPALPSLSSASFAPVSAKPSRRRYIPPAQAHSGPFLRKSSVDAHNARPPPGSAGYSSSYVGDAGSSGHHGRGDHWGGDHWGGSHSGGHSSGDGGGGGGGGGGDGGGGGC